MLGKRKRQQRDLRVIRLPMYIFQRWPVWADLAGCLILPSWSWYFLTQILMQNEFSLWLDWTEQNQDPKQFGSWGNYHQSWQWRWRALSLEPECFKWEPPASVIKRCNWLPTAPVYGICPSVWPCACPCVCSTGADLDGLNAEDKFRVFHVSTWQIKS